MSAIRCCGERARSCWALPCDFRLGRKVSRGIADADLIGARLDFPGMGCDIVVRELIARDFERDGFLFAWLQRHAPECAEDFYRTVDGTLGSSEISLHDFRASAFAGVSDVDAHLDGAGIAVAGQF